MIYINIYTIFKRDRVDQIKYKLIYLILISFLALYSIQYTNIHPELRGRIIVDNFQRIDLIV